MTGARTKGQAGIAEESGVARQRLVNFLQSRDRASKLPQITSLMNRTSAAYASGLTTSDNLLVKPTARRLGVTEGEASSSRESGLLATRIGVRDGRILLNFDAAEIERLENARRNRIGAFAAGSRLHLPVYAVERLVARKLLDADDHAWLVDRFGTAVLTESSLQSLQDRLASMACSQSEIADEVDLATVMRGFGGGPKPWETIFDTLLSKELPFCIVGAGVDTKTICIGSKDVDRCLTLQPGASRDTFTQADALEVLNLLPKHGRALNELRTGCVSSTKWEIEGNKLLGAAKRYVSYPELVSRTGLYSRTIRHSLLGLGCHLRKNSAGIDGW